jgi:hypothetical protein
LSANLQACSFLLGRLQREVARFRALSFPGHDTGPRKWLNLIGGLLDTASTYLEEAELQATNATDKSRLISEAEHLGGKAYYYLTFVTGSDSTQIPHQVVAPFQRWVTGLGIAQTVFFRAEHAPNYELLTADLKNYALLNNASASLVDAIGKINWPALRVSVPGHSMGLLPHFAVVAHELGHAIQGRINIDLLPYQQSVVDALTRIQARLAVEKIQFTQEFGIAFGETIHSWMNEFKADAVGNELVGPAFFFALCGFLELAGHGYGIAKTHPPSDLRRALLFQSMNAGQLSFAAVLADKAELILTEELNSPHITRCLAPDDLYAELKQSMGEAQAAICVELIPVFTALAPAIFAAAHAELNAHSPSLIYSPQQLSNDLDRHLEMLCNLVPPIEYEENGSTKPAALSTILNVGWVALLTRVDRFPPARGLSSSSEVAARLECLHELLLKATELAEARSLWEECA